MANIKIIKLHNNTEIIGSVIDDNVHDITIEDPFTINYMFSSKNERPIIGLLRYMPFADQRIMQFSKNFIVNSLDARKSMASYYEMTVFAHENEIDETIDNELENIAELEMQDQDGSSDIITAMLERMNPNNKTH